MNKFVLIKEAHTAQHAIFIFALKLIESLPKVQYSPIYLTSITHFSTNS